MANVKISELTALTPPDAADLVPVTDASASQTKRTTVGEIVGIINGDVDVANDGTATISELPVSKLQDGTARQLLQTDAAGTGVEWTSNVDVPGTLGVDGQSTLASAAVSDLTSGRVVLAGTSGELEDSAGLTFNGTQLDVDGDVVITGDLTVEGSSTVLETQTAGAFSPTSGTVPTNGVYLPSANNVAISANSVGRLFVAADGTVSVKGAGTAALSVNGGAPNNSLVIDSLGRAGLGTGLPSTKLSVIGAATGLANGAIRTNTTAGTQSANSGLWLCGNQATTHYNWLIASQYNVGGALEITPSTAVDGATFTTPTAVFTQTGRVGIGNTSPTAVLDLSSNVLRLRTAKTPASATDTGNAGDICWDANYVYVCTATNTWKRSALSTW